MLSPAQLRTIHVSDVVPLSAALEAFESLRAARTMKILIDPHA
jgi:hypothetical protein